MCAMASYKQAARFLGIIAGMAVTSPAQVFFTNLASFVAFEGAQPFYVYLVQGTDGAFYETTFFNGSINGADGWIFQITPAGALATLHNFVGPDGINPAAGLVLATDGNFYGTTTGGGAYYYGTVFKITPEGRLTTLHSFDFTDGYYPMSSLVQATDGNFYGTTYGNGGTIFKMTPGGTLTVLHNFNGTDGANPEAGLIQATDGSLYGTTQGGGANGSFGTAFKISTGGTFTTLHSFNWSDGASPVAGLVQATDGDLYGTTALGGANGVGTIFKITRRGRLTTLYSFCAQANCADGSEPYAGLTQATDGNFYGTTFQGGVTGDGTIFKFTPTGSITTLHTFDRTDGEAPYGGVTQGTDGNFYGTTNNGGANSSGTVFSLSVGLGPFVRTLPTSGKVGSSVDILGTNLTGPASVTFGGTPAAITFLSSTEIKATVPSGATTGKVQVTTPSGTLSSNVAFRVTPVISNFSPTSGPVGTVVTINGETLTGATSVTFGGVKATSFKVKSYTQITATVPAGAKTGRITVATPGGRATSAGTFTVN